MDNSLIFLYVVFAVSIVLYILAAITIAGFVIPLQVEQTGVKNGLVWLRRTMLRKEFLSILVIIASIFALTARFFIHEVEILRYIITSLIFIHAFGTYGKAKYDRDIYTHQYSDESKELHRKIDALEKGIEKRKLEQAQKK